MNKKYSDRTKKKVIEQYLAGVSVSDLVSKFNVSRTTVYTWTRDHKKKQKHEAVDMKKHKELQHRCERLEKFIKILQEAPFTKAASLDEKNHVHRLSNIGGIYSQSSLRSFANIESNIL